MPPATSLTVDASDHLVVNVSDVEISAAWRQAVLGMTREDFGAQPGKAPQASVKFGVQKINLRPISASKDDGFTADHEGAGSDDLCFLTASSPDAVVAPLQAHGVAIEAGPPSGRPARAAS
jgi:catechol 2,3-dioxygenase-like lactoylglutathione lyase family enzyme